MSEYPPVRTVDVAGLAATGPDDRASVELLNSVTGSGSCMVQYIVTPPGVSSRAGLHTHDVDQCFYLLSGTMMVEIDGEEYEVPHDSLIVFPKHVSHRSWNAGDEPTVHLAINTPSPPPGTQFSRRVEA